MAAAARLARSSLACATRMTGGWRAAAACSTTSAAAAAVAASQAAEAAAAAAAAAGLTVRRIMHGGPAARVATAVAVRGVGAEEVKVTLTAEGGARPVATSFDTLWLWYNSPQFIEPDSGQRTLEAHDISRALPLRSAAASGDGRELVVTWADGNVSRYDGTWLAAQDYSTEALTAAAVASRPPTLGDVAKARVQPTNGRRAIGKEGVPRFAFSDVMASDAGVHAWLAALNEYGLTVITGAPTDAGTVLRVAGRISAPMRTIYGESFEVAVQPKPINIAYAPIMLGVHVDLAYYESPPGVQLLHCRRFDADITGGESTFMDGLYAAEELRRTDPAAFAVLARVPATFQKVHYAREVPAHIVTQRPHITLDRSLVTGAPPAGGGPDVRGEITSVFWAPAFEGPLRVKPEDVRPYYAAYRTFADVMRRMETEGTHMVEYRMEPGDISVFNNRRMLHGRREFHAAPGARETHRVLQGAYVNIDEFNSRLHALATLHGGADRIRRVCNGNLL